MSLTEFEKRVAARPEVTVARMTAANQANGRAFHERWLADAYPYWAGPLKTFDRSSSVERVGHAPAVGMPSAVFSPEAAAKLGDALFVIQERVFVSGHGGIEAAVIYGFDGDDGGGKMVRLPVFRDRDEVVVAEGIRTWTGSVEQLVDAAIADVGDAASILGELLVRAVDAREVREQAEALAREEAERAAEEQRARLEIEREAEQRRMEEAALRESERMEAEKAAAEDEAANRTD